MGKTTKKTAAAPRAEQPPLEGVVIPAGAKVPQDHLPKSEQENDVRVVKVRGKEWKIPTASLDDFELLDDLNALDQRGDPTRMPAVLRRLLGDQWSDAMETLRDKETGRVSVSDGADFVMELMGALDPNSSGS